VKRVALSIAVVLISVSAYAKERIHGRVEAGGAPIAGADVTAWLAGPGAPQKLGETRTDDEGFYDLPVAGGRDDDGVLYLIAGGERRRRQPRRVGTRPSR